ncbi:MAG: type I restriction endonuclease subunit R [Mycoplasmoidaceae bacterium]
MILYENAIEDCVSNSLEKLGYFKYQTVFNKNNKQQVIDYYTLEKIMIKINKGLKKEFIDKALNIIKMSNFSNSKEGNIQALSWLRNGVPVKLKLDVERTINVKLIDFYNIDNNVFNYTRQLEINSLNFKKIIPDIIIYINGLPLSVIELKSPEANEKLKDAYWQVKGYVNSHMDLGTYNLFSLVSNGFDTKYGAIESDINYWWSWKKKDINSVIEENVSPEENYEKAFYNYEKNIHGLYNKNVILNMISDYIFWVNDQKNSIKYIPSYHQYWAVEKTIISIKNAKDGQGGVVWHTQGSGKSVSMVFLAKRIKSYIKNKNFKIVYVTDRNELEDQLYKRIEDASGENFLCSKPKKIKSRSHLVEVLSEANDFGIYLVTIQKFTEESSMLSINDNIIVIADEAHRSHNNIETDFDIDKKNNQLIEKYGYAKYIRDAFPNATFVGFTGTPLMGSKKTIDIFGHYIDLYPMTQSVLDGSTVPIHFEKRRSKLHVDLDKIKELDDIYEEEIFNSENEIFDENAKYNYVKKKLINIANILSDENVIKSVVEDFWKHYRVRAKVLNGKALFVAFNRKIAFQIYNEMIKQNPEFNSKIKLVITESNKDSLEMSKLIPNKKEKKEIANEFKKSNSKYKIIIVVDMWLTGFDVPDLDTLYLFKIIKYHNLMQTIARVNRTFSDEKNDIVKNDGLIVDYIGIWKWISEALKQYAGDDRKINFDIQEIKIKLLDKCLEIKKNFFYNKDYDNMFFISNNEEKYKLVIKGINIIESLNKKEKELFYAKINLIIRWFKLCSQALTKKETIQAQYYILLGKILRKKNVDDAIDFEATIKRLREKMNEIITTGEIEVSIININDGRRDLAHVMRLIEKEMRYLKDQKEINFLKIKQIKNEIKNEIKNFSRTNPIKGQELSKDLCDLIDKFDKDKNLEKFLIELMKFSQVMKDDYDKNEEIGGDETIRAFYSILASDKFNYAKFNSEILREIINKIYDLVKKDLTDEWHTNKMVRNTIHSKIKLMLRKDYNYPPDYANDMSGIIINEIDNTIIENKDYFNSLKLMENDEKNNE